MENPKDLGERIHAVRAHLGLNKAVFGARVGISGTSVNNLETGAVKNPSGAVLSKISSEFDISLEWLQHGEGPMLKHGGQSFHNAGTISGGQNMAGAGQQYSQGAGFNPQGLDLIAPLEKEIEGLKSLLAEKDERIQELKERIQELKDQLTNK